MTTEPREPRPARLARLYDDFTVDSADSEQDSWLLTYLDTMTLLLVMLVVLLAFSDRVGGESTPGPLPLPGSTAGVVDIRPSLVERRAEPQADPSERLAERAREMMGDAVEVLIEEGRVSFRVSNEILFPSGRAELTVQGGEVLTRMAALIEGSAHDVAVEGHTDDVPIQTLRFPSNWELSTARATSVVRSLVAAGVAPTRLRATGYAETRPLLPNDSETGRAANRRVEVILESRPSAAQ